MFMAWKGTASIKSQNDAGELLDIDLYQATYRSLLSASGLQLKRN